MKPASMKMKCAFALVIDGILAAGPVMADKPSWAGAGKGGKDERADRRDDQRGERSEAKGPSAETRRHFEDRHHAIVRDYYGEPLRGGRCPPGLAKKQNGCMPPGQSRKWQLGRALPRDVVYYEVPHARGTDRPAALRLSLRARGG